MTPQLRTALQRELAEIDRIRLILKGLRQESVDTEVDDLDGYQLHQLKEAGNSLQMAIRELNDVLRT